MISAEAWRDLDWGMMVWLFMTTGAHRGEVCALRWDRFDAATAVLVITTSVAQRGGRTWEKDTKTHQQRRIALDAQTVALLVAYRRHCAERAGLDEMPGAAHIFSPLLDGSTWIKPDTVSQRYERMCARIGWDMHILWVPRTGSPMRPARTRGRGRRVDPVGARGCPLRDAAGRRLRAGAGPAIGAGGGC